MPFKDKTLRQRVVAASMRRSRLYDKALAAAHPLAVAAENARSPMRPAWALEKLLKPLPAAEREPRLAEYRRLHRECSDTAPCTLARYRAMKSAAVDAFQTELAAKALS